MRVLLVLAAVAAAAFALADSRLVRAPAEQLGRTPERSEAVVVRVVDGDTVRVALRRGDSHVPVRLIGIDTPELRPRGGGPPECYARAATAALDRLVDDREVTLVADAESRDRYGRLLFHLRRDGLDVNAWLVRNGFARTLVVPPNDSRAEVYARAQEEARRASRGLWRACGG